jgi:hypothetical protein
LSWLAFLLHPNLIELLLLLHPLGGLQLRTLLFLKRIRLRLELD